MRRILFSCTLLFLCCYMTGSGAAVIVPAPPKINASSYLVMDYNSGDMMVSEDPDKRLEPASLTKIMTVYVAAHELAAGTIHMNDKVHVSEKAWRMPGSRMFIKVNTDVTVSDLLHGILVQSGNDASVALAEYIAGSEDVFVQIMNQYAKKLGMVNTHYANATGLPHAGHYSTARDLAILTRAFISEFPNIYALNSIKKFTYNGITQDNRNTLLWRDEGVDGVKTGHTESAGYCLVASAKRDNMRLISVVMGTDSENARINTTQTLLSYAFRFFETRKLYSANQVIQSGKVWKGDRGRVALGIKKDLYVTIPRGAYKQLDAEVKLQPTIMAPVHKGEVKGTLDVVLDGKEIANRPLRALQSVGEGSLYERLRDEVELLFE